MSYSAGDYFGELVPCLQTVKFPNLSETYMRVSINGGTPKSSTLIGFSLINHPFWGTPIYGNPHIIYDVGLLQNAKVHGPEGTAKTIEKPVLQRTQVH